MCGLDWKKSSVFGRDMLRKIVKSGLKCGWLKCKIWKAYEKIKWEHSAKGAMEEKESKCHFNRRKNGRR